MHRWSLGRKHPQCSRPVGGLTRAAETEGLTSGSRYTESQTIAVSDIGVVSG